MPAVQEANTSTSTTGTTRTRGGGGGSAVGGGGTAAAAAAAGGAAAAVGKGYANQRAIQEHMAPGQAGGVAYAISPGQQSPSSSSGALPEYAVPEQQQRSRPPSAASSGYEYADAASVAGGSGVGGGGSVVYDQWNSDYVAAELFREDGGGNGGGGDYAVPAELNDSSETIEEMMLGNYLASTLSVQKPRAMVVALQGLRINTVAELVALSSLQRTQVERGLRDARVYILTNRVEIIPRYV